MTVEAAVSLGETLGVVSIPRDTLEMKGVNFMRIRVAVDVTKPLCRGRMITWDQGREGWASFMYERLPKICYWCGHLSHNDKECPVWLGSKGDLSEIEQQFRPWLRASQFNPTRKTTVEVQGFDDGGTHRTLPGRAEVGYSGKGKFTKIVPTMAGAENNDANKVNTAVPLSTSPTKMGSSGSAQTRDKRVHDKDTARLLAHRCRPQILR